MRLFGIRLRLSWLRLAVILTVMGFIVMLLLLDARIIGRVYHLAHSEWQSLFWRYGLVLTVPIEQQFGEYPFRKFDSEMEAIAGDESNIEEFKQWLNDSAGKKNLMKGGFIWERDADSLEVLSEGLNIDSSTKNAIKEFIDLRLRLNVHQLDLEGKEEWLKLDSLRYISAVGGAPFSIYYGNEHISLQFAKNADETNVVFGIIWNIEYYKNKVLPDIIADFTSEYKQFKDRYGDSSTVTSLYDTTHTKFINGILLLDSNGDTLFHRGSLNLEQVIIINNDGDNLNDPRLNRLSRIPSLELYIQFWSPAVPFFNISLPELTLHGVKFKLFWHFIYLFILLGILFVIISREIFGRKRQQNFIAYMSHELRTPVAKVRLFAETLKNDRTVSAEKEDEFLDVILQESDDLSVLIDNSLNLVRFDDDRMKFNMKSVDTSSWLKGFIDKQKPYLEAKGFEYIINIAENLPEVEIDEEAMNLVIRNIMDNAVKYSFDNKRIAISAKSSGKKLILSVSDNGIGIPKSKMRKVFKRFYRIKHPEMKPVGGVGIGLNLVKQIVKAHKGKVWIDPDYSDGTKVIVELKAE